MSKYTTEALRSVALVGHGAAGKTSLAEALLFATGAIAAKGSVDKGNTVGDADAQEKEAGHSLTSAVMNFGYEDTHVHLIDTPGYPDFAGQAIAALEAVAGAALLFITHGAILRAVDWLTRKELIEDPLDPLAAHVTHLADRFSADSQHFYALYLLTHGLVKLVVVILLARRIAAAYPLAIGVFGLFIAYQLHRWSVTHSPMMLALSAFDVMLIWLTWGEWQGSRKSGNSPA